MPPLKRWQLHQSALQREALLVYLQAEWYSLRISAHMRAARHTSNCARMSMHAISQKSGKAILAQHLRSANPNNLYLPGKALTERSSSAAGPARKRNSRRKEKVGTFASFWYVRRKEKAGKVKLYACQLCGSCQVKTGGAAQGMSTVHLTFSCICVAQLDTQ